MTAWTGKPSRERPLPEPKRYEPEPNLRTPLYRRESFIEWLNTHGVPITAHSGQGGVDYSCALIDIDKLQDAIIEAIEEAMSDMG